MSDLEVVLTIVVSLVAFGVMYLFPVYVKKDDLKAAVTNNYLEDELKEIENLSCPVCGYYCLGNGGHGCIDKKSLYESKSKEHGNG